MNYCSSCGHELGDGRYCTNCGQPVQQDGTWRTDTAERAVVPSVPPTEPPPSHTAPPAARFPLFADEVDEDDAAYAEAPQQQDELVPYDVGGPAQHRRRVWWPWLAGAAVLLVVIGVGLVLLTGGDDSPSSSSEPTTPAHTSKDHGGGKSQPTGGASTDLPDGDITSSATVTVPDTAPPGQDAEGNRTTYDGGNMLDGQAATCWRMPGDGSGEEIVVNLPEETHLTSVGLVNGYAKTDTGPQGAPIDWYHANRRIQRVEWVFDDGTTVSQDLGDVTDLQSTDVDVTTTTVTLRLVTVSAPGKGAASRDYTAISDLSLVAG